MTDTYLAPVPFGHVALGVGYDTNGAVHGRVEVPFLRAPVGSAVSTDLSLVLDGSGSVNGVQGTSEGITILGKYTSYDGRVGVASDWFLKAFPYLGASAAVTVGGRVVSGSTTLSAGQASLTEPIAEQAVTGSASLGIIARLGVAQLRLGGTVETAAGVNAQSATLGLGTQLSAGADFLIRF